MEKKQYISPTIEEIAIETDGLLAVSVLSLEQIGEGITPSDEEYDGEFQ
ncbi:MAG: hypothetical protein IJ637_01240 [Prevotella sp.]|nr:hypothetical protein [Prevotella sp.]